MSQKSCPAMIVPLLQLENLFNPFPQIISNLENWLKWTMATWPSKSKWIINFLSGILVMVWLLMWRLHAFCVYCMGLNPPDYRCSAHMSAGTAKRLATSKTMGVPEVSALYECLRTVIKHFECSVKNKELLDECMELLELTPLHLISWCQTRMAHFLKSCNVFEEMLPAVYDVMYTRGIRFDERDRLFTASNIFIIKSMAELHPLPEEGRYGWLASFHSLQQCSCVCKWYGKVWNP